MSNKTVLGMEVCVRELEGQLVCKTLEVEILKAALDKSGSKTAGLDCAAAQAGRFPMKAVAQTLGVSRSNLHQQRGGTAEL